MNPEPRMDPKSATAVKKITDEDIVFSTIAESYPALESLVDRFDLCSVTTGDRLIKTEQRLAVKPQPLSTNFIDYSWLMSIVARYLSPDEDYTKDEVIGVIQTVTKGRKQSATKHFNQMVETGVLTESSLVGHYCYMDSTPF